MDLNFSDNDFSDNDVFDGGFSGTSRRARSLSPFRNERYSNRAGWRYASTDWDMNPNSFGENGDPGWKRQRMRYEKSEAPRCGYSSLSRGRRAVRAPPGSQRYDLYNLFRRFDQFEEGWVPRRNFGRVIYKVGIQVSRTDVRNIMAVFRFIGNSSKYDSDKQFDMFDDFGGQHRGAGVILDAEVVMTLQMV